ncbi:MAG: nucleotidyltransferase [Acidobacteriota bacterium]
MLKDQKELLSVLNARRVDYVVVGGHAAIAYGVARLTKDLDILVRPTEANGRAVYEALAEYGAPVAGLSAADFHENPNTVVQFGVTPNRIDILQRILGLDFDQAWANHVDLPIDDDIVAHYLSLDDLLLNKELVGRPQDLADVHQLRKIKNLR